MSDQQNTPPPSQNLGEQVVNLDNDLTSLRGNIINSLMMGDSIFGEAGHVDIKNEVKKRNNELKQERDQLRDNIDKKEVIIQKNNRDFSDVKDTLPEIQPNQKIRVIEDYTVAFLTISYLFMGIAFIYFYTATSTEKINAFFKALLIFIIISLIFLLILYYVL
jgi:Icc-related predicted phosphoesterase